MESESDEEDQNQHNGKVPAISSRCSVKKLHDLIASLDEEKGQYVCGDGFWGVAGATKNIIQIQKTTQ